MKSVVVEVDAIGSGVLRIQLDVERRRVILHPPFALAHEAPLGAGSGAGHDRHGAPRVVLPRIVDGVPLDQDIGLFDALRIGRFPVAVDIIKAGEHAGQVLLIADIGLRRLRLERADLRRMKDLLTGKRPRRRRPQATETTATTEGLLAARDRARRQLDDPDQDEGT